MTTYFLDKKTDLYFRLLCKRLKTYENTELFNLISNAHMQVGLGCEIYHEFGKERVGHLIIFNVSSDEFIETFEMHQNFKSIILKEFNAIFEDPLGREYIHSIIINPNNDIASKVKDSSSHCLNQSPTVSDDFFKRVWSEGVLRIFISHIDTHKVKAKKIQEELKKFQIASFVAHEDIEPTEGWIKEIMCALMTMDICLCLITDDFFESIWTNQEVGFALGRDIPVIPIKVGETNPKGFISILQAGRYERNRCAQSIVSLLLNTESISVVIKNKIIKAMVTSLQDAPDQYVARRILEKLKLIRVLNKEQTQWLVDAFNRNVNVQKCKDFSGYNWLLEQEKPEITKRFLAWLEECTSKRYTILKKKHSLELVEENITTRDDDLRP